ncbi:Adenylate kinase/UMP-CMP kinase like protein [Aduncisulcus paluster]|uniref:Adenylate kinase/UMP-CMP kinase like protein n=1 Tax=Aduncisulcus paluster TaxID=2918883 RepID=A0ABQ5K7U3_9EUKA|nr:Adenylate kinase/UMP-CMP kinase like protein [Aduncisulcus paluster]
MASPETSTDCHVTDKIPVVFILGAPGTGKNTQCDMILGKYSCDHFSAGGLLREELKKEDSPHKEIIADTMRRGSVVPGYIIGALLREAIQKAAEKDLQFVIIDGFPRSIEQRDVFISACGDGKAVIVLETPKDVLVERLMARAAASTSLRLDDNPESIKKRFLTENRLVKPVLDSYEDQGKVYRIESIKSPEEVFIDVCKALDDIITK